MVEEAADNGIESVVINYRGMAGIKLTTPKTFSMFCHGDFFEGLSFIYKQHCKDQGRKIFALGVSMGACILCNLIGFQGENCFLDGAFCSQSPFNSFESSKLI